MISRFSTVNITNKYNFNYPNIAAVNSPIVINQRAALTDGNGGEDKGSCSDEDKDNYASANVSTH
jgi:hypothetical protein